MRLAADRAGDPWRAAEGASDLPESMAPEGARSGVDQTSRLRCASCQSVGQSLSLGSVLRQKNGGEVSGAHERRREERPRIRCASWRGRSRIDLRDIGGERGFARIDEDFEAGSSQRVNRWPDAESGSARRFAVDVLHNEPRLREPALDAAKRPLTRPRAGRSARRARRPGCRHSWACNSRCRRCGRNGGG